jgi:iron complex transport system substrate-binding protein
LENLKTALAACLLAACLSPAASAQTPKPSRIVSINQCSDELLLALAEPGRIAGVTRYPKPADARKILEEHPEIRTTLGSAEEVLALKPDLVLAGVYSRRDTLELLRRLGLPLVVSEVPQDFDAIHAEIRRVAAAVGEPARGEALIREMQGRLGAAPSSGPKPGVLFYGTAGHVPGTGTFEDAVIRAAGARNLAAEKGIQGHGWLGLEDVIALKPDVLVFSRRGASDTSVGGEMLAHPALAKALPKTRVAWMPAETLHCGSQDAVEAVEALRKELA